MNKLVWRFMKLAAVVFVMYFIFVHLLYIKTKVAAPFRKEKSNFEVHSATKAFNIPRKVDQEAVQLTAIRRVKPVEPPAKVIIKEAPSKSQRTYDDTLLMQPQQKYNFYHNIRPAIWPGDKQVNDDRIISQMSYGLPEVVEGLPPRSPKKILAYSGRRDGMKEGDGSFKTQKCPVNECHLTFDRLAAKNADVILWQDHVSVPGVPRPLGQIWMIFLLESPYHTPGLAALNNKVNWTATYRRDSTIVAPYERFTLFNSSVHQLPLIKNYAAGKTKKVAWFVSNCGARNNRLGYAKELGKYIEVDIYGACGPKQCPRASTHCFDLLTTTYKFYLAFENSNCRDYITEKFFVNGLQNDVIPIVMGAHPDDYRNSAPKNSYIHVDDFESPEKLAEYLLELDKDDEKYNEYFKWKGTGDNLNTYFWCRLCAMAHATDTTPSPPAYENVESWWRGPGVCKSLGKESWPRW